MGRSGSGLHRCLLRRLGPHGYSAHWFGTGPDKETTYDRQAEQTLEFMTQTAGGEPHVLIGDLNVWEGTRHCGQSPNPTGIPRLRGAGYVDAWPRIHPGVEKVHRHDQPQTLRLP